MRADGFPDYTVRPAGVRPLYTRIVYLEPFTERNLAAFGYDIMSEVPCAKAKRRAAESGRTAISAMVKLVQQTHAKEQAGFLMYVPIYHKDRPPETAEQHWNALRCMSNSPSGARGAAGRMSAAGKIGGRGFILVFSQRTGILTLVSGHETAWPESTRLISIKQ